MKSISSKSARELNQIINFLPEEYLQKIPAETIEYLKTKEDKNYITKISCIGDITENNVLEETKNYLAYIFLNYLSNEEEKREYENLLGENESRNQKESEKYDIREVFERRKNKYRQEERSLIIIEEKNLLKIIFEKIKNLFRK